MRIVPLLGSLRGVVTTPSGLKAAQASGMRAVQASTSKGFSTSASRFAAEAKKPKTTSDAKIAAFLFFGSFSAYVFGKNMLNLMNNYYPYPWIMEDHYTYTERLKKEAEAAKAEEKR